MGDISSPIAGGEKKSSMEGNPLELDIDWTEEGGALLYPSHSVDAVV
jgi:hypothetical protein